MTDEVCPTFEAPRSRSSPETDRGNRQFLSLRLVPKRSSGEDVVPLRACPEHRPGRRNNSLGLRGGLRAS